MNEKKDVRGNPKDGSSDDFFNALERQVNGAIADDQRTSEETPRESGTENLVTHEQNEGSTTEVVDWEKRYKDSSREATRMRDRLNNLKPFVPILDAMKKDGGLVKHVRGYLENGGAPAQSVTEKLQLDEDFVFDSDEALKKPDSDSAKVLNAHVDGLVQNKLNNAMKQERVTNNKKRLVASKTKEAMDFVKNHNMSKEEFQGMLEEMKKRPMTLEDMYYIINKDKANSNAAKQAKADMLTQMKNVRDIPTSAGGVNSPKAEVSQDDQIFDALRNSGGIDELFSG